MPRKRKCDVFCNFCGALLVIKNRKYNRVFCSSLCSRRKFIGQSHPSFKGGRFIDREGYVRVLIVGSGRYELEHRRVVEQSTKKKLKTFQSVHHIDGNKQNNSISNLMVMDSVTHGIVHKREFCPRNQKFRFGTLRDEVTIGETISIRDSGYRTYLGKRCVVCGNCFWARTDYNSETCSNSCGQINYGRKSNNVRLASK